MINKIKIFFSEVKAEMQKVTWSTRDELIGSTSVVLFFMVILSVFIGVSDFVFANLLKMVLR